MMNIIILIHLYVPNICNRFHPHCLYNVCQNNCPLCTNLLPEDEKDEVQEQFRWVYGYYENWDNWDKEEKNVFNDIQKDIKKI